MRLRGINYDTGRDGVAGGASRIEFDQDVVAKELAIIATDLHCDAVRITGADPDRIAIAADAAVDAGLHVWFAPFPVDLTPTQLLPYFERSATIAQRIQARDPDTVLVLGCEMSLFGRGFVPGESLLQRLRNAMDPRAWIGWSPEADLGGLLGDIAGVARRHFGGGITYASGDWEDVDWSPFDFAAVDLYRSSANAADFAEHVRGHSASGKPLVITEFGCCAYRGAAEAGGAGWAIVDNAVTPRALDGDYVRDEGVQVAYFQELMDAFEARDVHGAFWFTFAGYAMPFDPDPRHDLDLASFGVVKILDGRHGTRYPDMNWEPKRIFDAIANRFDQPGGARRPGGAGHADQDTCQPGNLPVLSNQESTVEGGTAMSE